MLIRSSTKFRFSNRARTITAVSENTKQPLTSPVVEGTYPRCSNSNTRICAVLPLFEPISATFAYPYAYKINELNHFECIHANKLPLCISLVQVASYKSPPPLWSMNTDPYLVNHMLLPTPCITPSMVPQITTLAL